VRRWGGEADAHPRAPAGCDPDEQEPETRPACWLLDGLGHTTQVVSPHMAMFWWAGRDLSTWRDPEGRKGGIKKEGRKDRAAFLTLIFSLPLSTVLISLDRTR
jgi:hypothetical protein